MYYCEELGYYVNSPDCGLCEMRYFCENCIDTEETDSTPDTQEQSVKP